MSPDHRTPLIIPTKHPETVRVASDETEMGYVIINASEFNSAQHTLYDELPAVNKLEAYLAELTDADAVRALQTRDNRKSAVSLYEARLAALAG